MLRATSVLEKLKAHPVLQYLNLDGVGAFTRLVSHLKRDILQPQPIPQINPGNTCFATYIRRLSVVQALWMAVQIELICSFINGFIFMI